MTTPGRRFPDFFLVGAAKSGTTSLFRYLVQHPSVFIPRSKELHYFADTSVSRGGPYRTLEAYLRRRDLSHWLNPGV